MDEEELETAHKIYMITCIIAGTAIITTISHCLFLRKYEQRMQTQWNIMLTRFETINKKRINVTEVTYHRQKRLQKRVRFDFPHYDYPKIHRPILKVDQREHITPAYEEIQGPLGKIEGQPIYANYGVV